MKLSMRPRISVLFLVPLLLPLLWTACGPSPDSQAHLQQTSLHNVKLYALDKAKQLNANAGSLKSASDRYYDLAKTNNFNYQKIAKEQQPQVLTSVKQARNALLSLNTSYCQVQGIVAGVPSLQQYDLILATGVAGSGSAASDNDPGTQQGIPVPFDLKLPNGRVLPAPGNLIDVLESSLWGLLRSYQTSVPFDYQTGKSIDKTLPDANILKGAADTTASYTAQLLSAVQKWQPTLSEVFNALSTNLSNVQNIFDSWEITLFVDNAVVKQFDATVHSRPADIIDMITGWKSIYSCLSPLVRSIDQTRDTQIVNGFNNLKGYVSDINKQYIQSPQSKNFDLPHVDLLKTEATNRANKVEDQVVHVAAALKVTIQQ